MRVLLAFDKFKDALTAPAACATAAAVIQAKHPAWRVDSCPLADGGEGFGAILTAAAQGSLRAQQVAGPRETRVSASYAVPPALMRIKQGKCNSKDRDTRNS